MDFDIEVKVDGERYSGSYSFSGNMVSVYFKEDHQSAQIDGAAGNIDALAKQMLRSLVMSVKSKKNA